MCMAFFFFKQKTAYEMRISDWSSDVCSSDLHAQPRQRLAQAVTFEPGDGSLGLDRRIDFLHGAPVVAVGLAMDVPLRVQDARTLAESVFHVFGLERGLQRAHAEIGRASCRERVCQYV